MFKKIIAVLLLLCLVSAASAGSGNDKVKAIVVFKDKPTTDDIGYLKTHGGAVKYNYNIISGVALEMPAQAYDKINEMCQNGKGSQPAICEKIASVELDQQVQAFVKNNNKGKGSGKPAPSQPAQVLPWGIDRVDAELSWGNSTGNGVKVAVVDTGIDFKHPDLAANVKGGVSFVTGSRGYMDDNGHGTHVAGTIAAANNDIGVVGVAPDAWLYGVKVLDKTGSGWLSDVIAGIDWSAANGMQVITMSLGSSGSSSSLQMAVDNAYNQGIVVVAAAGNDYYGAISYPAKYDSVIAVTATDSGNNIAYFSNIGPEAELAAPGVGIYSTYKGGTYATLDGTSMATPHVTGTVALLLATQPDMYDSNSNGKWDPPEVRTRLHDSATDLGAVGRDDYFGYGLVNALSALS
jgi:subtilisin family serine protease